MASFAAIVLFDSDDPVFVQAITTVAAVERLRAATIGKLPDVTRVVAVMPEELARLMCAAHDIAAHEAGFGDSIRRPPAGYVAPADRHKRR